MDEQKSDFINKLKEFSDKNFNWILLAVLAFAFIIRWKYMTINAAVWWDEADYLSLGKYYGEGLPHAAAAWRARVIPMVWGIFYWMGANEWFIRFIEVLVSLAGIYLTYLIGKKFYNKWVGVTAALGLAVYFEYLFWTARISLDVYALTIWALIAYLFWKGWTQNKKKHLIAAGVLYAAGIYAYDSIGFMAIFFALFLLLTTKFKFIKDKRFWYLALAALIAVIPFTAYNYVEFGDTFQDSSFMAKIYPRFGRFATADFVQGDEYVHEWERPMMTVVSETFVYFKQMPYMLKWPFLVGLLFGVFALFNMFLGFDMILKGKGGKLKRDLYIFLWAVSLMIPMGLVVATTGYMFEPRLIFPAMPAVFILMGLGFTKIYEIGKKYNKEITLAAIIVLIVLGINMQLTFAKGLIDSKKDTFSHHKIAGEWLKDHTEVGDVIIGCGLTVNLMYYSEREFKSFGTDAARIEGLLEEHKPKYFLMDGYDQFCDNPNLSPEKYIPVQVLFIDEAQTQPIMIIYEVKYGDTSDKSED